MEPAESTKAHCNRCAGETNHSILYHDEKKWRDQFSEEPGDFIYGEDRYDLLKCAGCGRVTFRYTSIFSENTDDQGRLVPTITYFPPAAFRRQPKWLSSGGDLSVGGDVLIVGLPESLTRMLREVYVALHNDCRSLSVMGVRAILERAMIESAGDHGSFVKNLQAFQDAGFIGRRQKEILQATLEIGHASIHRNYNRTRRDLEHVLDIAENILEAVYISAPQAALLRKGTPKRGNPA